MTEYARAQGYLVVNPVYALNKTMDPAAAINLRMATIPGGAVVKTDRELQLLARTVVGGSGTHRKTHHRILPGFHRGQGPGSLPGFPLSAGAVSRGLAAFYRRGAAHVSGQFAGIFGQQSSPPAQEARKPGSR